MPQETVETARYMTVMQPDGIIFDSDGATLPDGKRMSHAEYDNHRADEDAADRSADEAMREETTRSDKSG